MAITKHPNTCSSQSSESFTFTFPSGQERQRHHACQPLSKQVEALLNPAEDGCGNHCTLEDMVSRSLPLEGSLV